MTIFHVTDIRGFNVLLDMQAAPVPGWLARYAPTHLGGTCYEIVAENELEMQGLLETLRDNQVAFGGALAGWPPAEIVADRRDQGKFNGSFLEIVFLGGGRWEVRER